jgi:hypothetical protein
MLRRIGTMYKDIYSALYEWNLKRWSGDDYMASFMTAAGLTGALMMNTALAVGALVAAYGPNALAAFRSIWVSVTLFGILSLVNYIAFLRHDQYKYVVQRFRAKPAAAQRRVKAVAWAYVIASYGLPIGFFFLMAIVTQR